MLKKLIVPFCFLGVLLLIACNPVVEDETEESPSSEENPSLVEETEPDEEIVFEFTIEEINDEQLAGLEDYIEVNYADKAATTIAEGINLHFHFNQRVRDFSLIETAITAEGTFVKSGSLYEVGTLEPEVPLVLTNYFTQGSVPRSGFYFEASDGEGHWFVLSISQIDGTIVWQEFDWSHDYDLYEESPETDRADYHIVQEGETLFSIARLYSITIDSLQQLNNLGDSTDISVGQRLNISQNGDTSDAPQDDGNQSEQISPSDVTFTLEVLEGSFDHIRNSVGFDYAEARNVAGIDTAINIAIRTSYHLTDFQVITLDINADYDLVSTGQLYAADSIDPYMVFIITNYFDIGGSLPHSGFSFVDEQGIRRYFAFGISQMDGEIRAWEIEN